MAIKLDSLFQCHRVASIHFGKLCAFCADTNSIYAKPMLKREKKKKGKRNEKKYSQTKKYNNNSIYWNAVRGWRMPCGGVTIERKRERERKARKTDEFCVNVLAFFKWIMFRRARIIKIETATKKIKGLCLLWAMLALYLLCVCVYASDDVEPHSQKDSKARHTHTHFISEI